MSRNSNIYIYIFFSKIHSTIMLLKRVILSLAILSAMTAVEVKGPRLKDLDLGAAFGSSVKSHFSFILTSTYFQICRFSVFTT